MPCDRYRHRKLTVVAIQFTGGNSQEIAAFLLKHKYQFATLSDPRDAVKDEFIINTSKGDLRLTDGYWLVLPPRGEVLLYRPDVFDMMYEVDD